MSVSAQSPQNMTPPLLTKLFITLLLLRFIEQGVLNNSELQLQKIIPPNANSLSEIALLFVNVFM